MKNSRILISKWSVDGKEKYFFDKIVSKLYGDFDRFYDKSSQNRISF